MTTDKWAQWLLTRRDGDSAALRARNAPNLAAYRDGVLDGADLRPDDVVLDVGCGTGLIGFGALERLGPEGRVIFCDVSQDLLDHCRQTADDRCGFVRASAEDLTGVADASVDVVTTRSVLIYADDKAAAFAEFFRVLRPGGRISLFEPINNFAVHHRPDNLWGLGDSPVKDLLVKIRDAYTGRGAVEAMMGFDERDLLGWALGAGFEAVELDFRAQVDMPADPIADWETLKRVAPNPLVPTYGEVIATALTDDERARLDEFMTAVEKAGTPTRRTIATTFLRARRP